ncbi:flap endonuclease [Fodinisporobacter ferrooxydans]|uniref:5'-3' exonuclease n=1 Tax=Fodinisporobacter ferrooxydans TaxID=2901836 RepID=A0ABY4CSQ3_9BACL|nr:flap endonuclease [Alicyclobacillaceae bacterium MYW30-H2]
MKQKTLLLIDGFNLLSRCYFATSYGRDVSQLPRNNSGLYINALTVMFRKIFSLLHTYAPSHMAVCWDVKRNETKRKELFDLYKGTRTDLPEPLIEQFLTSQKLLDAIGIFHLSIDTYEADDIIGAIASRWSTETNEKCFIYSNDRDLLQLLDDNVSQIIAGSGRNDIVFTVNHFQEKYGILPPQWIDVKALLGDKSDNIPGVAGVGEKAAIPLIKAHKNIHGIYNNIENLDKQFLRYKKKLIDGKEMAFLSRQLAEIITEIPQISELDFHALELSLNTEKISEEFNQFELGIQVS